MIAIVGRFLIFGHFASPDSNTLPIGARPGTELRAFVRSVEVTGAFWAGFDAFFDEVSYREEAFSHSFVVL